MHILIEEYPVMSMQHNVCVMFLIQSTCSPPYGYRHEMTLSRDDAQFATKVNNSRISGNLDAPEGGFDALMQVPSRCTCDTEHKSDLCSR